ncbi:hypothetical protein TNCV_2467391 [Trichonephila clavipes]|nr:hypothetical protein TNCV_2467391 [Trichonephila clavipes]
MVVHYPDGIWLMASIECMGGLRAKTPQRCSAGCSVYRQCAPGTGPVSLCITQQFRTSYHGYPNLNLTIVILQAKVGFVSKHNVVPFRFLCLPFIAPMAAQMPVVFQSRIN